MCYDRFFLEETVSTVEVFTWKACDIFNHAELDLFSSCQVINGRFLVLKKRYMKWKFGPLGWLNQAM